MGRPRTCSCGECQKCRHREYMREWYATRPGYAADMARKHRSARTAYEMERYRTDEVFRAKKMARMRVNTAVSRGKLERQPCETCGAPEAEAHHHDYKKPMEVTWLCKQHHEEWHASNTTANIA